MSAHDALAGDPSLAYLRSRIRDVPDFPKPGILFKDIAPLVGDPRALHIVIDSFTERFVGDRIDIVVGIESRGFIFGGALAVRLNASFVPVRKPGKLPYKTDSVAYALEYGEAVLHMHVDAVPRGARVLVVDDLLATGGTAGAAAHLIERQGGQVVSHAFVIELDFLEGRKKLGDAGVFSLVRFGDGT
jgi:adenine phosphoribosyltransferase